MAGETAVSNVSTVQSAYDQLARFALRPQLYFDGVADVRPTNQSMRGNVVVFPLWADMAAATTELTETADVTAIALSDSTVSVTLREYGNAAVVTRKLEAVSYVNVVADAANIVGFNAGLSMDTIVRTVLSGGTNQVLAGTVGTTTATLAAGDILASHDVREVVADLRGANVMPFGSVYNFFIHPDVSVDLREETGASGWVTPANYSAAERRWNGEIGQFDGGRFIETPHAFIDTDAGAGNVDVYHTIAVGQQALAKAYANIVGEQPQFIVGPITDKLRRFRPMGWYWLGGYAIYRQASLRRIESSSSLGANV